MPDSPMLSRDLALRIINQLRNGSNCLDGASAFSAGRTRLIRAAAEQMEEVQASGGAAVRWIRGRTGQGKTHFFARLMEIAHGQHWVTSYVQISAPGSGTELHRFEEIYRRIVDDCMCTEMVKTQDGHVEPGRIRGWDWILDDWWSSVRRQASGSDAGEVPTLRACEIVEQVMRSMRSQWSLHPVFASALREYALSRAKNDEEWSSVVRAWFRGEDTHVLGAPVKSRLREAGIQEPIGRRNAKDMLRSLSMFLRYRGFGGILVLLDELENVLKESKTARHTSYIILRELIDNVDLHHGMTNTIFYVAATPDVFDSEKGLSEYEALAERVMLPGGQVVSPMASVIDLAAWPLVREDFLAMAARIAEVYGVAKAWTPVAKQVAALTTAIVEQLETNPDLSARDCVKIVVHQLDALLEKERT